VTLMGLFFKRIVITAIDTPSKQKSLGNSTPVLWPITCASRSGLCAFELGVLAQLMGSSGTCQVLAQPRDRTNRRPQLHWHAMKMPDGDAAIVDLQKLTG
jgi:hypothetical protein